MRGVVRSFVPQVRRFHSSNGLFNTHAISHEINKRDLISPQEIPFEKKISGVINKGRKEQIQLNDLSDGILETKDTDPEEKSTKSHYHALRKYQKECIEMCLKSLASGKRRIAVSLGTGGGKTVIFSHLLEKLPLNTVSGGNKVLVLVHRKELADQAAETIQRKYPQYKVEIDMAKFQATHGKDIDVTVASVPTLARSKGRLELYNPDEYKAIIIDECHHAVSSSYKNILAYFNADHPDSDISVIGFSATLKRHDNKPLKTVFDEVVYDRGMKDLIQDGHLSDFSWAKVSVAFHLDEVELTSSGDYRAESLAKVVNTPVINELVLRSFFQFKQDKNFKHSLFFCVNVSHMRDLSALFRRNGINAHYITGETKKSERIKLLNEFKNGEIPVLMNCAVFTEGTDIPIIDSIFLVRPTRSTPLLIQMLGRGLRLHQDKEKCFVVDFVDSATTGIELEPTLKGTRFNPEMDTTGVFESDQDRRNGLSPMDPVGQVKYIEVENFEGYEELLLRTKKPSEYRQQNDISIFAKHKYRWSSLRKNIWAFHVTKNQYFKIERDRNTNMGTLSLVVVSIYLGIKYPKTHKLASNHDLNVLLQVFEENLEKLDKSKIYTETTLRGRITEKQLAFLRGKLLDIAMKSPRIKLEVFTKELDDLLPQLSKLDAANLIFGYSVAGKSCLQIFIKSKFLRKKESTNKMLE